MSVGGDKPEVEKVTLREFIEENHRLLSVLGVFTALAVFARGLALTALGQGLSLCFLSVTILLWLELMVRYPRPASMRLVMFENIVTATVFLTAVYGLVAFDALAGTFGTAALVAAIALTILSIPIKSAFARLAPWGAARGKPERWITYLVLSASVFCLSLALCIWLAAHLGPRVSGLLATARTELGGESPRGSENQDSTGTLRAIGDDTAGRR